MLCHSYLNDKKLVGGIRYAKYSCDAHFRLLGQANGTSISLRFTFYTGLHQRSSRSLMHFPHGQFQGIGEGLEELLKLKIYKFEVFSCSTGF